MKDNLLKGLTEEQVAKIKACKSQEEVLKLAKEEGIELNDEQLEAINGGCGLSTGYWGCPYCGQGGDMQDLGNAVLRCPNCGNKFTDYEWKYYKTGK